MLPFSRSTAPRLAPPLALLAALVLPACGPDGPRQRAKHLLFITVDTLRADRLGCYGGPNRPSPTIDRLAAEGVLFEDAYAQRGMTLPSFASFFTSKYPSEHGVIDNLRKLGDDEYLLSERLADAGFRTHAFNASGVLKPERGNVEQGYRPRDYRFLPDEGLLTHFAETYLRERFGRDGTREFVWVHYMAPHKPYDPPREYVERFASGYDGPYDGASETLDRIYIEKTELAKADLAHIQALYDGEIAFADDQIARVLAALEASGQARDTLVVFAADHGEDLYSHHAYFYHGNSIYRSSTHIPLIFRQPGALPAGRRIEGIVESVDFLPTVLAWLGLPAAPGPVPGADTRLRGVDLTATLLEGTRPKKDLAFAQLDDVVFSARNRDWMLISNPERFVPTLPPADGLYPLEECELYHVAEDPDEQVNLCPERRDVVERFESAIDAWYGRLGRREAGVDASADRMIELEQLGYVEGRANQRGR